MTDSTVVSEPEGFHAEMFFSDKIAEPILVRCWCGIGHDHSYAEWVERYHEEAEVEAKLGLTTYRPILGGPRPTAAEQGRSQG